MSVKSICRNIQSLTLFAVQKHRALGILIKKMFSFIIRIQMARVWKVRMYREGDETGIVSLFHVVPGSKYTIKRWFWEYKNNPFGCVETIAECNGQIVGHMGLIQVNMKIGDNIVRGSQAVDLIVHPNFRRQGMFLAIGKTLVKRAAEDGASFSYGFPNVPAYHGHLKYGWLYVNDIPILMKCLNLSSLIRPRLISRDGLIWGVECLLSTYKGKRYQVPTIENPKIHKVSSFDKRLDKFWNSVSKGYGIIVVRSMTYLNWRYFRKPYANYKAFIAEKDGRVEGFMILYVKTFKYQKVGYIVDILAGSRGIFRHLIHAAVEYFTNQKVDFVLCWMLKSHFGYKILKENGFIQLHNHRRLIARINSPELLEPYKSAARNWYVTMGDSDLI